MKFRKYIIILLLAIFLPVSVWAQPETISGVSGSEEVVEWKACVQEAKAKHPDLVSASEKIKQTKAAKEVTRSVMMPQITGGASEITSNNGPSSSNSGNNSGSGVGSGSSSANNRITTYQYNIAGQQLLFDGFKSSYDLSTAERNIRASRYSYDVTSSNIRLRLRTAFVNLLVAQELVKVTAEIEARRKQTLQLVKSLYEGGREHKGSLLKSEADLAQATYQVDQARRNIYYSQRQLTKELGRAQFLPMMAAGDLEVKEKDPVLPNFEMLAQTVPLLEQLIEQREAAKFGLKSAYANFVPQIFLTGSEENSNTRWPPDQNQYTLGTTLTWPIFDGGNRFAAVSQNKAALGQAVADERSGRDGVIVTMVNTWTQLQNTVENVGVQKKQLDAAAARAKITEAEYAIGLVAYDDWIIIEDNYVNAKISYLSAEQNALTAEASWIQAKGGTLNYDKE